jgi:hypothetical protein
VPSLVVRTAFSPRSMPTYLDGRRMANLPLCLYGKLHARSYRSRR